MLTTPFDLNITTKTYCIEVLYPTLAGGRSTLVKWHIKTEAKPEMNHTFFGLIAIRSSVVFVCFSLISIRELMVYMILN